MAKTYNLTSNPWWYLPDLSGKPLQGFMLTWSSRNPNVPKYLYQEPNGDLPYPQKIYFDGNGLQGPFYAEIDSGDPEDLYYIEIYDTSVNPEGVQIYEMDNFGAGMGGGGSSTTAIDLNNLVVNSFMYDHLPGAMTLTPNSATKVALSTHSGLTATPANAGPDILFIKSASSGMSDTLSFQNFAIGLQPFPGDVAPSDYLRYDCTIAGTGETRKYLQIPITSDVRLLQNTPVTIIFYAKSSINGLLLQAKLWQFCGDGSGATIKSPVDVGTPKSLTTGWDKYTVNTTIPPLLGTDTIGKCNNSGLFLQIEYPYNTLGQIDICKPSLFFGDNIPKTTYDSHALIAPQIYNNRTGDIKTTINANNAGFGWLAMNDGTIGSPTSGADYARNDSFPLFNHIWNLFHTDTSVPPLAPIFDSSGAATSYGASAIDDYNSDKRLSLTRMAGRLLAAIGEPSTGQNTGTKWAVGQFTGNEMHTNTIAEMAAHSHGSDYPGSAGFNLRLSAGGGDSNYIDGNQNIAIPNTGVTGSGVPYNIQNPVTYINVFIKL